MTQAYQSGLGAAISKAAGWPDGAAFVEGEYVPIGAAKLSLLDWGFTKSDVTYDVVHVWEGAFYRLEDHFNRFYNSMAGLRMSIPHDRAEMTEILSQCVRLTGRRRAYVAMVTTRGVPVPGAPRKPSLVENRFHAYALPWIDILSPEIQERGAHVIIAEPPRIDRASVDPTIKNYQWGDLTQGLFEAEDKGADVCMLLVVRR